MDLNRTKQLQGASEIGHTDILNLLKNVSFLKIAAVFQNLKICLPLCYSVITANLSEQNDFAHCMINELKIIAVV